MEVARFSASAVAWSLVCQTDAIDARSPVLRPAARGAPCHAVSHGQSAEHHDTLMMTR